MNQIAKMILIGAGASLLTMNAYAHKQHQVVSYKGEALPNCCDVYYPHWYAAASLGVSHLYDDPAPGSGNSVDENGPGGDATLGYQFTRMYGAELGYTQYYNSREVTGNTVIAKTTHFAVHLNAVGRYPVAQKVDLVGKLGLAYAYAQKVFTTSGGAGSSGSLSPYLGLGVAYNLTPRVDLIGQWSFVRGNNYTGSNTLYSLGLEFAII